MKKYDVLAICNALVDILVKVDDQLITDLSLTKGIMHLVDDERQSQVLARVGSNNRTIELGGSSLNAIRSLAALGARTVFAGTIGQDEFGRMIHDRMQNLGIIPKLQYATGATGSCAILITPDGERTMNTNLGASCLFDAGIVPHEEIKESKVLHFCGYQWHTETQRQAILDAIQVAESNETLVSFDAADPFVVKSFQKDLQQLIEDHADIVFANQAESELLYNSSPEHAVDRITATGAIAVVKLGAQGALIGRGKERYKVAPVPTKVLDTTGAGDMFAAGFLYGFTKGLNLPSCGVAAATLASDVISRIGATVSHQAFETVKTLR